MESSGCGLTLVVDAGCENGRHPRTFQPSIVMNPQSTTSQENTPASPISSRRNFVGGLTTGLAATLGTTSFAKEDAPDETKAPGQTVKRDPAEQYPKPPFQKQLQEWPGLASKMTPPPDHGEKSYEGRGRLQGRKALITGGDSGIGRAVAIAFAREGADVAISYYPTEEPDAKEVLELIRAAGRKAVALPGDIREEAICERLVADAVKQLGGLDILVNNAGRQQSCDSILDLTTEAFDATYKTNCYAPFWITKAALPHLEAGASILFTASEQAMEPSPNLFDYASTKAVNANFTKSLSKQLADKGIRVNAVAPGPVWTPLQISGGQPQEKLATFGEKTAFKRAGQPAELAPAYVLLASQESSFVTGHIYDVQGGKAAT
ncbi:MAG: short-chain dehydrogenase/reductase [Prosthecobacter sp.]|nr:short-chain dehydrogenase/reductase [Prosthecobacter sp.]